MATYMWVEHAEKHSLAPWEQEADEPVKLKLNGMSLHYESLEKMTLWLTDEISLMKTSCKSTA